MCALKYLLLISLRGKSLSFDLYNSFENPHLIVQFIAHFGLDRVLKNQKGYQECPKDMHLVVVRNIQCVFVFLWCSCIFTGVVIINKH